MTKNRPLPSKHLIIEGRKDGMNPVGIQDRPILEMSVVIARCDDEHKPSNHLLENVIADDAHRQQDKLLIGDVVVLLLWTAPDDLLKILLVDSLCAISIVTADHEHGIVRSSVMWHIDQVGEHAKLAFGNREATTPGPAHRDE